MKQNIYIFLLLLLMTVFVSCESWFDVSPKAEIRAENLFKDEEGFWDALTGIYIGMTDKQVYGANLTWGAIEYLAWNYNISSATNSSYYNLQRYDYNNAGASSTIDAIWRKQYNIIAEINYLLRMIEEQDNILSDVTKNTIKGEALALRAFLHFDLIRLFSPGNIENDPSVLNENSIPYVTVHDKEITERKSYRETLSFVMKDIDDALKSFDSYHFTGYMNMNQLATLLLRARVALWANDARTLEYANEAINAMEAVQSVGAADNSQLLWAYDDTQSGSGTDQIFSKELVFRLDVMKLEEYITNSFSATIGGNTNYDRLVQSDNFVDGIYEYTLGSNSDLRFRNWYETAESNTYLVKKLRKYDGTYGNRVALMRMSEAYLIAAECCVESNKSRAVEYMNLLKVKRAIANLLTEEIEIGELRALIAKEYRREFQQEGQLFFYYKRKGVESIPGSGYTGGNMGYAQYVLPIPDSEKQ